MIGDSSLVLPNIVDAYNQGAATGRADRTRRTLAQYLQPALGGDQGALAQIYQADPQAGVQTQNQAFNQQQQAYTQQQQAYGQQQQARATQLQSQQDAGDWARKVVTAASQGDMQTAQQLYSLGYQQAAQALGTGQTPPAQLSPEMLPHLKSIADTISPEAKPDYTYQKGVPTGGYDSKGQPIVMDGYAAPGRPFLPLQGPAGSTPAAPAATPTQNLNAVPQGTLAQAVMAQESGGNPNAVSPKGAQGLMQLMPSTAANPGFGIQPAQDNSPQENMRVGGQYLNALSNKYGGDTNLTLAAYNAGPGRVDQALQAAGGDPQKAIASLPAETQAYVPGVLGRMGGGGAPSQPLAFGQSAKVPKQNQPNAPSGYRFKADGSGSLEPIPGGPSDAQAQLDSSGMTPDAITDAAWDKILNGKDIQGMGKAAVQQRAAVRNQVAQIAKDANVSPQDLVTTSGRNKALQASLTNLQKQGDMMNKNEETFQNNAQILRGIATQLNQGGGTAWNNFVLKVKSGATSDPLVAKYNAALETVAQEYSKIAQGATGAGGTTEGAREHAYSMLNKGYSLDALNGTLDTLQQDINGQKQANDDQLNIVRSHMTDFGQSQPSAKPASKPSPNGWSIQLVNQ